MALQLGAIITAVRDRHPAFHPTRVPNAVLARFFTDQQRILISKLAEVNRSHVAQQCSISLAAVAPENALGAVGAGSPGGLPAEEDNGVVTAVDAEAGAALELDFANGQVLVSDFVGTGFAATYIDDALAAWTVNAYAGKFLWVVAGNHFDTKREIISNTATRLVYSTGSDGLDVTLDSTDVVRVVSPIEQVTAGMGIVTTMMPQARRYGYLVKLDAQGLPYIDVSTPIVAKFDQGIELPPHESILGGTVRFLNDPVSVDQFRMLPYSQRTRIGYGYWGWEENGQLFLSGRKEDWAQVDYIDLRYVPVSPEFAALTDYFLLRDEARSALVAHGALFAAERCNGMVDTPAIDLTPLAARAQDAEAALISGAGRNIRAFAQYTKTVW